MALRPIFYDTETTGVRADKDYVIELSAYDPVKEAYFDELINPNFPIPEEATKIHNITNEMVQDKDGFQDVGQRFVEFCEGDVVLVAHNNDNFDKHFLRCEFARSDLTFPTEWKFFDTLKWARKYRPDLPRHSLQYLRETFGFEANNAHRAMDDVIILYKVYLELVGDLSIDKVVDLLYKDVIPTMTFGKHKGKAFEKVPRDYVLWLKDSGALDKPENQELFEAFDKLGFLHKESLL
jgi:DNA polymerase III subunit epsilon